MGIGMVMEIVLSSRREMLKVSELYFCFVYFLSSSLSLEFWNLIKLEHLFYFLLFLYYFFHILVYFFFCSLFPFVGLSFFIFCLWNLFKLLTCCSHLLLHESCFCFWSNLKNFLIDNIILLPFPPSPPPPSLLA